VFLCAGPIANVAGIREGTTRTAEVDRSLPGV
jgi:hypothetical protein